MDSKKIIHAFMQLLQNHQEMFVSVSDRHIADLIQQIETSSEEEALFSAIRSFCRHYPAIRDFLLISDSRGAANTGYPLPDDKTHNSQELLILINAMRVNQPSKNQDDVKEPLKNDSTQRKD